MTSLLQGSISEGDEVRWGVNLLENLTLWKQQVSVCVKEREDKSGVSSSSIQHVSVYADDDDNEDNWPPVNEAGAPWIRQTRYIIAWVA